MASEAFKAKMHSDIINGITAEQDLQELQEMEAVATYEENSW